MFLHLIVPIRGSCLVLYCRCHVGLNGTVDFAKCSKQLVFLDVGGGPDVRKYLFPVGELNVCSIVLVKSVLGFCDLGTIVETSDFVN